MTDELWAERKRHIKEDLSRLDEQKAATDAAEPAAESEMLPGVRAKLALGERPVLPVVEARTAQPKPRQAKKAPQAAPKRKPAKKA